MYMQMILKAFDELGIKTKHKIHKNMFFINEKLSGNQEKDFEALYEE